MFSKKTKLKLTDFECNLLINGMNEFRNMLLSDGSCIISSFSLVRACCSRYTDTLCHGVVVEFLRYLRGRT